MIISSHSNSGKNSHFKKILPFLFDSITAIVSQNIHVWLTTYLLDSKLKKFSTLTIEYYKILVNFINKCHYRDTYLYNHDKKFPLSHSPNRGTINDIIH